MAGCKPTMHLQHFQARVLDTEFLMDMDLMQVMVVIACTQPTQQLLHKLTIKTTKVISITFLQKIILVSFQNW